MMRQPLYRVNERVIRAYLYAKEIAPPADKSGMTRRRFGTLLFGGISLSRISTSDGVRSRAAGNFKDHIQNVRLFRFAAGEINLTKSERKHLHDCEVCQKMACVLIYQLIASGS